MAKQPPSLITFRVAGLNTEVALRMGDQAAGASTKRDLGRYYALMRAERQDLGLTPNQAAVVIASLEDTRNWPPAAIELVPAAVERALEHSRFDLTWGVNSTKLIEKLRSLTRVQLFALVDGVEQAANWAEANKVGLADAAVKVGLATA